MEKSMTSKGKDKSDVRTTTEVEKIENGFLIVRRKEWDDKDGWHNECKKFYSDTNPLEDVEKSLADSFKE